jgi:hypothetical protein
VTFLPLSSLKDIDPVHRSRSRTWRQEGHVATLDDDIRGTVILVLGLVLY